MPLQNKMKCKPINKKKLKILLKDKICKRVISKLVLIINLE